MSDTIPPEEGKFYRTRRGEKVGPFKIESEHGHGAIAMREDGRRDSWHTATGRYNNYDPNFFGNSQHDLVAEWVDTVSPQEGKFYRTRRGEKVGPAVEVGGRFELGGPHVHVHENNGVYGGLDRGLDLVAEWVDEPDPYTLDEIERLRLAIYERLARHGGAYDARDLEKTTERQLRTAILAGVRA